LLANFSRSSNERQFWTSVGHVGTERTCARKPLLGMLVDSRGRQYTAIAYEKLDIEVRLLRRGHSDGGHEKRAGCLTPVRQ
jgi:predicted DNA-binding ribbon-helix-helix protein